MRIGPERADAAQFKPKVQWLRGRRGNYNVRLVLKSIGELAVEIRAGERVLAR
jgi:hypothetical protein